MKPTTLLASLLLLSTAFLFSSAAPRRPAADDEQEKLDEAFAELLTGARMIGWFTDSSHPDTPPMKDSYVISRCEKADGKQWLIESVIGESGLKVPLYVDVEWAGKTPVITLDQLAVPQMGTFDARVLFHGKSYAGVWQGKDHGGEMVGRIERAATEEKKK